MANLKKIRVREDEEKIELIIDWDNDRHQLVIFNGTDPKSIKEGFAAVTILLDNEIREGYL